LIYFLGVSKKTEKPRNWKNQKKNNRKNQTEKKNRINRLKNHKKNLVRFGFGFQSLKPIEPNRTGSTRPPLKNKTSINRKFPNPKPTFSRPPSLPSFTLCLCISPPPFLCSLHLCISPLPLLSTSRPHLSSLIFLHAQLHDCYSLVVKLLLHAPLLKLHLLQSPPLPVLCLSSLK